MSNSKNKFKVWYDEKTKTIKAKGDNPMNGYNLNISTGGLTKINKALAVFISNENSDLETLVKNKQVVLEGNAKLVLEFDYKKGKIVQRKFTPEELIHIANQIKSLTNSTPVVEPVVAPVVDPTVTRGVEPVVTPVVDPVVTPVVDPVVTPVVEPVVAPVVEPVVAPVVEPVVGSDGAISVDSDNKKVKETKKEEKKKTSTKVKLKRIGAGLLVLGIGLFALCGGVEELWNRLHGNRYNGDGNDNDNENESRITSQISEQEETNRNQTDEELIESISNEDEISTGYYVPEEEVRRNPVEPIEHHDYSDNGSTVEYDSMEKQLKAINAMCNENKPHEFGEIVTDDDKYTIAFISYKRNEVLNGSCTRKEYMDNMISYSFENGPFFNQTGLKPFDELSPFSRYIVIVSSATILRDCPDYSFQGQYGFYTPVDIYESYDYTVDELTRVLTDKPMRK